MPVLHLREAAGRPAAKGAPTPASAERLAAAEVRAIVDDARRAEERAEQGDVCATQRLRADARVAERREQKRRRQSAPGEQHREAKEMVLRDVSYVPGLYKIFDEILVNAADNKQRDGAQSAIKVDVDVDGGYVRVWNNGEGIPVVVHKEHGVYLANIFSRRFVVETSHRASGRQFRKTWRDNMAAGDAPVVGPIPAGQADFTSVTFWPDLARFGLKRLDPDHVALLSKRVYDIAGVTPRDLKVYLNGALLPVRDFEQYVNLFPGMGEEKKKDSFAVPNERWQICVRPSNIDFQQVSFVNSIWTMKGGKHVDYIVRQVVKQVIESVKKKNKKLDVKPHQVKPFLWVFVNSQIENPAFDSQTKETLNTLQWKFGSTCEVPQKMVDALCKVINERMAERVAAARGKGGNGRATLDDANDAGGEHAARCTLILTEGDSAEAALGRASL
eukprot:gene31455-9343_t